MEKAKDRRKPAEAAGTSPERAVRSGAKKLAEPKTRAKKQVEKQTNRDQAEKREEKFREVLDSVDAGAKKPADGKKLARTVAFLEEEPEKKTNGAGVTKKKSATKRAKARKPNEKLTPASIYKKMIAFGKIYQVENEQDFIEAARIYAEEAGLIDQIRDQIAEDGLTVIKSYKTGDVPVAHPLLSELPRHVESANKCLATIGTMIGERGAKKQKPTRELDQFRLNA